MRRLGQVLVATGALLAFASSFMHGWIARPVVIARVSSAAPAETIAGLNAAWWLGTLAMIAFGLQALLGLGSLGRAAGAMRATLVAGLFFLGYGAWGFLYRHFHPHFIGFIAIGALFLIGAALAARDRAAS